MADVLHAFRGPIEDRRAHFMAASVGRQAGDGTWEGWLEFAPANEAESLLVTDVESRQQTHVQVLRWASGLTSVYPEGALHRAHPRPLRRPTLGRCRLRIVRQPTRSGADGSAQTVAGPHCRARSARPAVRSRW